MKGLFRVMVALILSAPALSSAESVRLKATADVWISSHPGEQGRTAGKYNAFKLKSIQEMAVVRFDAAPAAGREVKSATLFLHRSGTDMLRYVRVSTVNGDWEEGTNAERLSPGDGASYNFADNTSRRPWCWPGSQLCDVIVGSGNTLATWTERKELDDGWISVKLTPELVCAMVCGDTDGLALMEGGTLAFHNNFIHSVQSDSPPYVQVELGRPLAAPPAVPNVKAEAAPDRAPLASGAIRVRIAPAENVFCWRVKLNGKPVPRWKVRHPARRGPTDFVLDELAPSKECDLEVVAVSPGGKASRPARLRVVSSPARAEPPSLGKLAPPASAAEPPEVKGKMRVWACPPLVKVSPETGEVMFGDAGAEGGFRAANAVWDGRKIRLFGARGEFVSYQLSVDNLGEGPLKGLKVEPSALKGPGGASIGAGQIELYKNWYARNGSRQWQPAYCVPLKAGQAFQIPDPKRGLTGQRNQTVYVDVYLPKQARPGSYGGSVKVRADAGGPIEIPVEVTVFDFELPDKLSFWPQLNAYQAPKGVHDYYRLAHDHRSVFYYRYWKPRLQGAGKGIKLLWEEYDRDVGPLLSGEAFRKCRRAGVPVEAMALPFADSWPTPLSKETYNYQGYWPKKGDGVEHLVAHYMKAPYIGEALSRDYKDAFAAAQRQYIEHFRRKGWNRTEMQCVFVGKNTHRTQYGVNMWWTTDEPYHWVDWVALQYFGRMWVAGRRPGEAAQWVNRADISRPQWQGRVLDGAVDTVYFGTGAFSAPPMIRRCRTLAREAPLELRVYGGANSDNASNLGSVTWILNAYLNGASAALPWQSLGGEGSLDTNDPRGGGNALLAPGTRFGVSVVADMRLKAFRDAEQIVEYLHILARRYGLNDAQLRAMVRRAMRIEATVRPGASADNADALVFAGLKAWQLAELRRKLAGLILSKK